MEISVFQILFNNNETRFHNSSMIFSDLPYSKDNAKRSILHFQTELKKLVRTEIYYLPVFLGFPLRKITFVLCLL